MAVSAVHGRSCTAPGPKAMLHDLQKLDCPLPKAVWQYIARVPPPTTPGSVALYCKKSAI